MFTKKNETKPDLEMFTIYDSKVQSYDRPFFAQTKDDVLRDLVNLMRDPQSKSNKLLLNAEDFSVFKIGEYFRKTGEITAQNAEHIVNLHDLRAIAQPPGIGPT